MMKLGCYLFMAIVGLIGFMNMDERIKRINELYHKSQNEGLTDEEKLEQTILRQEYAMKLFRIHPFDFLVKPIREEELFRVIGELRELFFTVFTMAGVFSAVYARYNLYFEIFTVLLLLL